MKDLQTEKKSDPVETIIGTCFIAAATMIVLKILGYLDLTIWQCLIPIWGPFLFLAGIFVAIFVFAVIKAIIKAVVKGRGSDEKMD